MPRIFGAGVPRGGVPGFPGAFSGVPPLIDVGAAVAAKLDAKLDASLTFKDKCARLSILNQQNELVAFRWHGAQDIYWSHARHARRRLVAKGRKGGITTIECADTYLRARNRPHTQQRFLADTDTKAKELFAIFARFWDHDPQQPALDSPEKKTKLEFANGSVITSGSPGGKAAGRGATYVKLHGTEVPYWFPPSVSHETANSVVQGILQSNRKGAVVFEGTPNGADPWFYHFWTRPREWVKIFLPWFVVPDYQLPLTAEGVERVIDTLTEEERALIERHGLSAQQIAWRRNEWDNLGPVFFQEFPEDPDTMFVVAGAALFNTALVEKALRSAPNPVSGLIHETMGGLEFFVPPEPKAGLRYVIGADPSQGLDDGDWSALSMRDEHGGHVAAGRFRDNQTEFARRLAALGRKWNGAMIVPESNRGEGVISVLTNEELYPNIASNVRWNKVGGYWELTGEVGITMTNALRPRLLAAMKRDFEAGRVDIGSRTQLAEMRSVVKVSGTRYEGQPHDDLLFADLLALFALEVQPPGRRLA